MKSYFDTYSWQCLAVFSSPKNGAKILISVKEFCESGEFFFTFSKDKGSHFKLFFSTSSRKTKYEIYVFLQKMLENYDFEYQKASNDLLFSDFQNNTVIPIQYIESSKDFIFETNENGDILHLFLTKLGDILLDALVYNDYFVEEKNRLNFALQLIFMAVSKQDAQVMQRALDSESEEQQINENVLASLVGFYQEMQMIEQEENVENWVIQWLEISNKMVENMSIIMLIEVICKVLDLGISDRKQLLNLTSQTLQFAHIKIQN